MRDESSKIGNCTLVDDCLSEFFSVFGNFAKSSSRDSLESKFGLLNAEDKETDGTGINDCLSQLMGVLGDASKSPSGSFLD